MTIQQIYVKFYILIYQMCMSINANILWMVSQYLEIKGLLIHVLICSSFSFGYTSASHWWISLWQFELLFLMNWNYLHSWTQTFYLECILVDGMGRFGWIKITCCHLIYMNVEKFINQHIYMKPKMFRV
jgi:hypothetical protein